MVLLNDVEVRVLGSLVEKSITTPEYYPMTLNALVNACNQKTNREPVVEYDAVIVNEALIGLRDKALVRIMMGGDSRVPKYRHYMEESYGLSPQEVAVLDVLMLRGPQTLGELRARTERLYLFTSTVEIEATLNDLTHRDEPLVMVLPRQAGQKDARYAHLLAGEPELPAEREGWAMPAARADRMQALEETVEALRRELEALREEFTEFKRQFE